MIFKVYNVIRGIFFCKVYRCMYIKVRYVVCCDVEC